MIIARIEGFTRVLGEEQGYLALPIKDIILRDETNGAGTPAMVSAWELTPDEIERVKAGARLYLTLFGTTHPPVMLTVGDAPVIEEGPKD